MRCLFCKADSSTSRSREHIVPESFGNTEQALKTDNALCDCVLCTRSIGTKGRNCSIAADRQACPERQ